ncbi:peptidoglycan-binding protein [Microvirga sp. BT688]|uniref:Tc toxin subunit A-related protein n=1 Tax=Microvirga sp. TaxID=1873136 RepID=UPI0016838567|nr:neuraminidase-like domain-containing protein [Microvirga sp.]MBD2746699.1 peptidoglycan-binding protein [Microvirga sp.]
MEKIVFPLTSQQTGKAVTALQDALLALLKDRGITSVSKRRAVALIASLSEERAASTYGRATAETVKAYQKDRGLAQTGNVDEATAAALNAPADVSKGVIGEASPLDEGSQGDEVAHLQKILLGLGFTLGDREASEAFFGGTTRQALIAFQRSRKLPDTGVADAETLKLLAALERTIARSVRGTVRTSEGRHVPGLLVLAFDRDFRNDQELGEAVTDRRGKYRIRYDAEMMARVEKGSADIGLRIFGKERDAPLFYTPSRDLMMNAPYDAVFDVKITVVDGELPNEFEDIARELRPLIGDAAFEGIAIGENQDEGVFLARESGIEVGKIAHFLVAHRLWAESEIQPEYFYALLREDGLFGISPNRTHVIQAPVGFTTSTRLALYEASLMSSNEAVAAVQRAAAKFLVPRATAKEASESWRISQSFREDAQQYVKNELPHTIFDFVEKLVEDGQEASVLALLRPLDLNNPDVIFAALDQAGAFSTATRPAAAARLKLGALLGFNSGLVREVSESLGVKTPEDIRRLAKLQRAEWTNIITGGDAKVRLGGASISKAMAHRHASIIVRRFEKVYPTTAFAAQLARRNPKALSNRKDIVKFFDTHPALELREHRVVPFLKASGVDPKSIAPNVLRGVEKLQRVFRLTGEYAKTEGLLEAGYGSAADIVDTGKERFKADAIKRAGMSADEAGRVFEQAQNINFATVTVASTLRTLAWPTALEGASAVTFRKHLAQIVAEQPNLQSLGLAADACTCEHCRSIYSPAAYLADVWQFLRNRLVRNTVLGGPSTKTARDVLLARRPDLGEIDLNCDNALVEVPHIDIVCELLEESVSPDVGVGFTGVVVAGAASSGILAAVRAAGFDVGDDALVYGPYDSGRFMLRDRAFTIAIEGPGPNWTLRRLRQTHGTSEERGATPEYVNSAAYALLKNGKTAFGQPFDLFHEETRGFLKAANVDRATLMEALAAGGVPSEMVIAGEILGLSATERDLIFTASVAAQPTIWGVAAPAANSMERLDVFTRKTELEFDGIEKLIAGSYVRKQVDLFIRHLDNSCNLDAKIIVNLDDTILDRMHRVLRLARRTGIATADIDRLAFGWKLGAGDLADRALKTLAIIMRLSGDLGCLPARLITWLDVIPWEGERSQHAQLFETPAITGPLSPDLSVAAIVANEADELASPGSGVRLAAYKSDIATAFGVKAADLDILLARIEEPSLLGANPPLTFRALGALYGRVEVARILGLRASELVGIERLLGFDVLKSAERLREFVSATRAIQEIGVSVADLEYRLARRANDIASYDLPDATAQTVLLTIREGLIAAAATNVSAYNDALAASEQIAALEAALSSQTTVDAASAVFLVDMIRLATPNAAAGTRANTAVDQTLAGLVDGVPVKIAIDAIVASPADLNARKTYLRLILDGLAASGLRTASFDVARSELARLLQLPLETADYMLRGREPQWRGAHLSVGGVSKNLGELLTQGDIANTAIALTFATAPDLFRALRLSVCMAGLIAPFAPEPATVAFLLESAGDLGWLPLDAVRYENSVPPIALPRWLELADGFALIAETPAVALPASPNDTISGTDVLAMTVSGATTKPSLLDALTLVSNWPRTRLDELDSWLGYSVASYKKPAAWRAIGRGVELLNLLGVPIAEAVAYTAELLGDADRKNARRMLRARYGEADWLPALRAIMDPIRSKKRDALMSYVLANNPAVNSKADVYDYLLTDTEWSPKMPSSRIVHAHGTLQLFIERCTAGLEPAATADLDGDPDWSWWDWMRNYRVWEVNRKVFVEAQYYIRPEWRDDKTEPFADMENMLMQNELNEENIEAAFENYLDQLDQIAFLDVLATCYDFKKQDMHVFACTKGGEPRTYFHRVFQRERVWTAWTKIELDITGEHLIAFFRNNRLYLAWATFVEKGNEDQNPPYPAPNTQMPKAERYSEISLAISEYTGKKWLPRRVSDGVVTTPLTTAVFNTKQLFLSVTPDPERFSVDLYLNYEGLRRIGYFLLTGCKGYPEAAQGNSARIMVLPQFKDAWLVGQRFVEANADDDDELAVSLTAASPGFQTLFGRTPGTFRVTYPFQASEIDRLLTLFLNGAIGNLSRDRVFLFFGTLMPYFFEDNQRGYILIPGFYGDLDPHTGTRQTSKTFSNVRQLLIDIVALAAKYLQKLAAASTAADKQVVMNSLAADDEYARILAEIDVYRGTQFSTVVRNFYHPMSCRLREHFFAGGIPELLARSTQREKGSFLFEDPTAGFAPTPFIQKPYPVQEMEFGRDSAYGVYNWELAFHAPHMIASKLIDEERFDEAEAWLRYIFDPRGSSNDPAPKRFWNTKPFYERDTSEYGEQLIDSIMERLASDPGGAIETELADAVLDWRRNPFKPYVVARARTVTFQYAIVHLTARLYIGRGDQYFRRDSLEDLVMASLDYSRAERLLGPRPKIVPPAVEPPPETLNQLDSELDIFGNALRSIENMLPDLSVLPHDGAELPPPPLKLESLYFCIPPSEKLYELWDTLEERQFNLRNSRTIEGVERSLSIFAPPLSVEELIKAAAAGLSTSALLAGLSAPRPPYRFRVMVRHAIELAEVANSFSATLRAALASRDTEALFRLKVEQEGKLLDEQLEALKQEVTATGLAIQSASKVKQLHTDHKTFYENRPYMNAWEISATAAYGVSFALQAVVAIGYAASGGLALVPAFMAGAAGFGGSPTANVQVSGEGFASSARDFVVGAVGASAAALDKAGAMLERQGSYEVRKADWDHSAQSAQTEMDRADLEVRIAEIRHAIAKEQLRVHGVRRQQTTAEETFHKSKFTSREMFEWQAQQLIGVAKQAYRLASAAGAAAERCFNFELGLAESFVRPNKWDDSRRGLLAAENLILDLRKMENAYYSRNKREFELTKSLSLMRLDPLALIELRTSGRCTIQFPEAVFDLEHPGHYFRRIVSLGLSVPCVAGPYGSIPVKVTQISNRVRVETARKVGAAPDVDAYAEDASGDPRFRYNVGSIQTIATSTGQSDAGVFSPDVYDERYFPFEGSGLCSTFVLELPQSLRPFDYGTISDIIFNIRYTARDGGGSFQTMVANSVREMLNTMVLKVGRTGLFMAIDIRRDRPDLWYQLTSSGSAQFTVTADELPYFTAGRAVAFSASRVLARVDGVAGSYSIKSDGTSIVLNPPAEAELGGLLSSSALNLQLDVPVTLETALPNKLKDLIVVVTFRIT